MNLHIIHSNASTLANEVRQLPKKIPTYSSKSPSGIPPSPPCLVQEISYQSYLLLKITNHFL